MAKKKQQPKARPRKYTAVDTAEWLNITDTRVRQLVKEKILPEPHPHLGYHIKGCIHAYIIYLQNLAKQRIEQEATPAKEEKLRVETERSRIKLMREAGDVIPVTAAKETVGRLIGSIVNTFRGIGTKIAQTLAEKALAHVWKSLDKTLQDEQTPKRLRESIKSALQEDRTGDTIRGDIKRAIDEEIDNKLRELSKQQGA